MYCHVMQFSFPQTQTVLYCASFCRRFASFKWYCRNPPRFSPATLVSLITCFCKWVCAGSRISIYRAITGLCSHNVQRSRSFWTYRALSIEKGSRGPFWAPRAQARLASLDSPLGSPIHPVLLRWHYTALQNFRAVLFRASCKAPLWYIVIYTLF